MASDHPVDTIAWKKGETYLSIYDLTIEDDIVRKHFTKKYLYFLGAHEGCSCGFSRGEFGDLEDDDEQVKNSKSIHELKHFLIRALQKDKSVELYACWEGEQDDDIKFRTTLDPRAIDVDSFCLIQKEFIEVKFMMSGYDES